MAVGMWKLKKIIYSIEDTITDIGFKLARGGLFSKDSELVKTYINKKVLIIAISVCVFAAIVGLVIGLMTRVVIDPVVENEKLLNMYDKNKNAQYVMKNQEIILPEKNTPINRIPKVEATGSLSVDN